MRVLFEAVDPRGWQVTCTEDCWQRHVLVRRPWMLGWEPRVKKAIEKPRYGIYRSSKHPERQIYYLRLDRHRHLRVVVRFPKEGPGEVVTAYTTDYLTPGEVLIWPESHD